jgi:SET and MYND domain-containing protein
MYSLENKQQEFRSIRPIQKGEEITHAYIDIASTTQTRQLKLNAVYYFHCVCERCICSHPSEELEEFSAEFRRGGDADPQQTTTTTSSLIKDHKNDCDSGRNLQTTIVKKPLQKWISLKNNNNTDNEQGDDPPPIMTTTTRRELKNASDYFEQGSSMRHSVEVSMEMLAKAYHIYQIYLHPLNRTRLSATCHYMSLCIEVSDWKTASVLCKEVVTAYEVIYPMNHPMIGLQYCTMSDLLHQTGNEKESKEFLRRANDVLSISHGSNHELVISIRNRED